MEEKDIRAHGNTNGAKEISDFTKECKAKSDERLLVLIRGVSKDLDIRTHALESSMIFIIAKYLSDKTLAIACRVGKVWNLTLCTSPRWLNIFRRNYPHDNYVTSDTDPRIAKIYLGQRKNISKASADLDKAMVRQKASLDRVNAAHYACKVVSAPIVALVILFGIAKLDERFPNPDPTGTNILHR